MTPVGRRAATPGLSRRLKWAASTVGAVGAIMAAAFSFDGRYAKAEDVRQQVGDVKLLYLHSERRALQRQKFELDVAARQRRLTELELQRQSEIANELRVVDQQIRRLDVNAPRTAPGRP